MPRLLVPRPPAQGARGARGPGPERRERLYRAYVTRASDQGDARFDNTPLVREILALRQEEAKLLGIRRSDPCLIVVRRTEHRDSPITIARLVHPGSRYLLEGAFAP